MKGILTDNGGEFTSEEMREVASILDVDLKITEPQKVPGKMGFVKEFIRSLI